jgi:hypothetical protein
MVTSATDAMTTIVDSHSSGLVGQLHFSSSVFTSPMNVRALPYPLSDFIHVSGFRHGVRWHGRRDLNPQPPVLETGALPIELLPYLPDNSYLVSRCTVCFRSARQYFFSSTRSAPARLFLVVV